MSREALGLIETKGMLGAIEVTRAATQAAEVAIASAEHTESGRIIVKIEGDWSAVVSAVDAGARAAEQADQLISMHIIPRPDESVSPILPYRLFIDRYYPTSDVPYINRPKPTRPAVDRKPTRPAAPKPKPAPKPSAPRAPKPKATAAPAPSAPAPTAPRVHRPAPPEHSIDTRPLPPVVSTAESHAAEPKPPRTATPSAPVEMLSLAQMEAMSVVKLRRYARTIPNLPIQGRQISMANKTQLLEAIKSVL